MAKSSVRREIVSSITGESKKKKLRFSAQPPVLYCVTFKSSRSLSEIIAMNSEFVGLPREFWIV